MNINYVDVKMYGKKALFTDPVYKSSGEKKSYPVPTYEALKKILEGIYWNPSFILVVDSCKVINPIKLDSINIKNRSVSDCITLHKYAYLTNVSYAVRAHIEWNLQRPHFKNARKFARHYNIFNRSLKRGGRMNVYLGTNECCCFVEPCDFEQEKSVYDTLDFVDLGFMFHGYNYPEEIGATDEKGNPDPNGKYQLFARHWNASMVKGVIDFPKPYDPNLILEYKRDMPEPKYFSNNQI